MPIAEVRDIKAWRDKARAGIPVQNCHQLSSRLIKLGDNDHVLGWQPPPQ